MTDKYQNKYRIASARLKNWNYASSASYFITICTANREHYFGEIIEQKMNLSVLGNIVEQEWIKTIALRPDMNLSLGEFVVMPNHFHGIIFIGENEFNGKNATFGHNCDCYNCCNGRDAMHGVSTENHGVPTENHGINTNKTGNKFGPQSKNLASIVRGFKSAVTTWARKNNHAFNWQSRYHDHIIRNTTEYNRIANYILNNPANWQNDKFFAL